MIASTKQVDDQRRTGLSDGVRPFNLLPRSIESLQRRFDLISKDQLVLALSPHFGREKAWIFKPVQDGWGALVYKADRRGCRPLAVKIGVFSDTPSPRCDHAYLRMLDVHAPEVSHPRPKILDGSGTFIPYEFMVMEWIQGESLLYACEQGRRTCTYDNLSACASALAAANKAGMRGSGWGYPSDAAYSELLEGRTRSVFQGSLLSATEYLVERYARKLENAVSLGVLTRELTALVLARLADLGARVSASVMIHGDPSFRNFLFDGDRLTAIIDGSGRLGLALEDLAALCVFVWEKARILGVKDPMSCIDSLCCTYEERVGLALDEADLAMLILCKSASRAWTARLLGDDVGLERQHRFISALRKRGPSIR